MGIKRYTRYVALWLVLMQTLWGAEYRGQVVLNAPPPPATDSAAATPGDKKPAPTVLPLPGATVTATQGDKKLTAVSDLKGIFTFSDLPDGTWQLQVEMLGFSPVKQEVTTGSGLPGPTVEMKMLGLDQIQAVAQPAAPAAVVGPASTTSTTSTPSLTTTTAPPTSAAAPAASAAKPKNGVPVTGPATAFQRTDLNASAGPTPTGAAEPAPEVTTELRQQAADGMLINGSAQNGASSPFAQNPAFGNNRKGGPRLYTYALTLNESNSALNANNFSLNGAQTPKLPTNTLQGTFSFGGPIKIPHLIERNGPRFQMNYTRIENRTSNANTVLMPDAAERTGDFSQSLYQGKPVQLFDALTGTPIANNIIPASMISPVAMALLKFYPAPNFTGSSSYNLQVPTVSNTHTDNFNMNISKNFLRRNLAGGQFNLSDTRGDSDYSVFNFLDLNRSLGLNSSAFLQRNFTNRFFGRLTFSFNRNSRQVFPFFANKENVSGEAGITGNNQQPVNWGPPNLAFNESGISQLGDQNASTNHSQTTGASYLGTWNHGRHNIQFGGDFRWQQFNLLQQNNPRGTFNFTGAATAQIVNGVAVPGTGYDFADFLLGTPDTSAIAFGNADKYLRAKQPDLFFQDDWKVSPGLSLTLGLRYEYTSPVTEKYGRLVNLDIDPGFTAIAPVVASDPVGPLTDQHYPDSLIRAFRHEIEPLPAFAWRPFPASSMVVRGGYSVRYNTQVYNPFVQQMDQQSPLSTSLQVANSAANPLTLANGFYVPPNLTTNTIAVNPNFKIGYAQNWQLSVQRDLPGSLVMQATYNGIKGTHLLQDFAPNTYPTGAVNPCPSCPNGYTYYTSGGNSEREAGSLQLRRRLHNGFTAQALYTYSHTIDDAGALGGGSLGTLAQNWLDLAAERGPSTIDQRHLLNAQWQYTSGMGMAGGMLMNGWRGKVIKDWTFTNQITFGTGLPLTPTYPEQVAGINGSNVRASYTGASLYDAPSGLFLNPAAISAPAPGQWGNAGRDSIRGPDQFSMSAQLARSFKLNDRFNLAATINANNPLNHVVFGGWNTLITSQQFGTANSPNAMRTVNVNLRLTF